MVSCRFDLSRSEAVHVLWRICVGFDCSEMEWNKLNRKLSWVAESVEMCK